MTPPLHTAGSHPEVVTELLDDGAGRSGSVQLATSGDHKAVGRMFIATALTFLAAAVTLLVAMRIQLIIPEATIIRPAIFDRLLSAYGVTSVLLFAVPLFLGLISHIVPLQIGARAVALPRVNALSYWTYLMGGLTIYGSFLWRPAEAGTFALLPLSDNVFSTSHGVDAWACGVGLVALAFVFFAVNMIATVRLNRAPGMVWRRVPLFSVAATIVSYTLLIIGPIMIAAVTMLFIDRNFDGIFYETGEGGAPLLYEHLAFIFFTGIYVVVIVSAMGAISEIFSTFSRQPHFGQRTIAGSMAAFAVLGVLAWMQNMYSAPIAAGFLYFTMLVALAAVIPAGLIIFNWIATLRGGSTSMRPPLTFALGAAVLIIIGLAGEWAQSVIPVGRQLDNTMVAWGDTHFALIGAGVLGGFAALYYWFPKITGRYMGASLARLSFGAIIGGTLLMVIPAQLAGLEGMPVDVYEYFSDTGMSFYNLLSSLGAFVLAAGVLLTLVNAAASYNNGTEAGPDAWGGDTLEWFALSPAPPHNFDLVPDVRSNEPYRDIREAVRRRSTDLQLPPARTESAPEPVAVAAGESVAEEQAASEPDPEAAAVEAEPEDGDTGAEQEFGGTSELDYPEGEEPASEADGGETEADEDDGPVA